jgi:hypothetical protein
MREQLLVKKYYRYFVFANDIAHALLSPNFGAHFVVSVGQAAPSLRRVRRHGDTIAVRVLCFVVNCRCFVCVCRRLRLRKIFIWMFVFVACRLSVCVSVCVVFDFVSNAFVVKLNRHFVVRCFLLRLFHFLFIASLTIFSTLRLNHIAFSELLASVLFVNRCVTLCLSRLSSLRHFSFSVSHLLSLRFVHAMRRVSRHPRNSCSSASSARLIGNSKLVARLFRYRRADLTVSCRCDRIVDAND